MKVGILRCQQTEDICAGRADFKAAASRMGAFAELATDGEPVEIVGFVSCGGCPGRRAPERAKRMVKTGAEAILLASCIGHGKPYGANCPNLESMASSVRKVLPEDVPLWTRTHD